MVFISNGSFIDDGIAQGLRRSFGTEFSSIYIYNLRGRAVGIKGEARRKEGGNVFGEGTKTPVAIAVLVKDPTHLGEAILHYRDIGDYLTRDEKHAILSREVSLSGTEWETIDPNEQGDWINQRDDSFSEFQPIGDKKLKGKPNTPAVFSVFGLGVATNRDGGVYNFDPAKVSQSVESMVNYFNEEVDKWNAYCENLSRAPEVDEHLKLIEYDSERFSWDRVNKSDLSGSRRLTFSSEKVRLAAYRPFVKQYLYFDSQQKLNNCTYKVPQMFPAEGVPNRAFGGIGVGSNNDFGAFMVDLIPDLELESKAQWCSFYTYERPAVEDAGMFSIGEEVVDGYVRKENITDATLKSWRQVYGDDKISKWDIFYYIYALFHDTTYQELFAADLSKLMPRVPQLKHFHERAAIGKKLGDLHVGYESVTPYPLDEAHLVPEPSNKEALYGLFAFEGVEPVGASAAG